MYGRVSALLASFALLVAIVSGDPITISGNTIGDLVNVNVNVTANIRNEINQDYFNILGLLMSSTGDVELFRRLRQGSDDSQPSTSSPDAVDGEPAPKPKDDIDVEEALKKLFPKLVKAQ